MTVGEKIKTYRIEKGLTQEELGRELGVGKAAVQKYESGQVQNLKSAHIKKLCTLFNTIPWDFIFDDDAMPDRFERKEHNDDLVSLFNNLNQNGQQKVKEYISDLYKIEEYTK